MRCTCGSGPWTDGVRGPRGARPHGRSAGVGAEVAGGVEQPVDARPGHGGLGQTRRQQAARRLPGPRWHPSARPVAGRGPRRRTRRRHRGRVHRAEPFGEHVPARPRRRCDASPRRAPRGRRAPRRAAAAPRLRPRSALSAGHSACHAPSGRSSTASAAAVCSWAPRCGASSDTARTSTESTGFASAASPRRSHGRRRRARSARRSRGGRAARRHSRSCPHVGRADGRVGRTGAQPADGWCARAARRRLSPSSRPVRRPGAARRLGPGRAARRRRECRRRRRTARAARARPRRLAPGVVAAPASQPAALSPKVVGSAGWARVRATWRVSRWAAASRRRRRPWPRALGDGDPAARRARASGPCRSRPGWSAPGARAARRRGRARAPRT